MNVNHELSRLSAVLTAAQPRLCYVNAARGVVHFPGAIYVEGYIAVLAGDDLLIGDHGWLEYQGQIVDPTLTDGAARYEPGLRFSADELRAILARRPLLGDPLPVFRRFGWAGDDDPDMLDARRRLAVYIAGGMNDQG